MTTQNKRIYITVSHSQYQTLRFLAQKEHRTVPAHLLNLLETLPLYALAVPIAPPATLVAPPATLVAPPATLVAPPATLVAPPATLVAPPATLVAPPVFKPTLVLPPLPDMTGLTNAQCQEARAKHHAECMAIKDAQVVASE